MSNMVKAMCEEAEIPPKTNHSLRAPVATTLFQCNVPENIIIENHWPSVHRSFAQIWESVQWQHEPVSRVMMSSHPTSFQEQLANKDTNAVNLACTSQASRTSDVGKIFDNLTNCTLGKITDLWHVHMWQFPVEIQHYSVKLFKVV